MGRNNRSSYSTSSRRSTVPSFNQYCQRINSRQQKRPMATTAAVPHPQTNTAPQVSAGTNQGPGLIGTIAANAASIAMVILD